MLNPSPFATEPAPPEFQRTQTVNIPDVGDVEFPADATPEEITAAGNKLYFAQQKQKVQGEDKAARWVSDLSQSTPTGVLSSFGQAGVVGIGEGLKGLAVAAEVSPVVYERGMAKPPQFVLEAQRKRDERTPAQVRKDIVEGPLFKAGESIQDFGKTAFPVPDREQDSFLNQAASMAGGFVPLVASSTVVPGSGAALIGLQSLGGQFENSYKEAKAAHPEWTEDQLASHAMDVGLASGAFQGALFAALPPVMRHFAEKHLVSKLGEYGFKRWLAGRAITTAEGAALGAGSQAGENLITGKPVGEGVPQSAFAMGAMNAAMPYLPESKSEVAGKMLAEVTKQIPSKAWSRGAADEALAGISDLSRGAVGQQHVLVPDKRDLDYVPAITPMPDAPDALNPLEVDAMNRAMANKNRTGAAPSAFSAGSVEGEMSGTAPWLKNWLPEHLQPKPVPSVEQFMASTQPPVQEREYSLSDEWIANLDKAAAEAMQRIRDREKHMNLGAGPFHEAPNIADYAVIGAAKVAKRGIKFAQWADEMVRDIGEEIRPYLTPVWNHVHASLTESEKQYAIQKRSAAAVPVAQTSKGSEEVGGGVRNAEAAAVPRQETESKTGETEVKTGDFPKAPAPAPAKELPPAEAKAALIKERLPHLTPRTVIITVQKVPELPAASFVQVDEAHPTEGNTLSSNPEALIKAGFKMPNTADLLTLPAGKYRLDDAMEMLKKQQAEDLQGAIGQVGGDIVARELNKTETQKAFTGALNDFTKTHDIKDPREAYALYNQAYAVARAISNDISRDQQREMFKAFTVALKSIKDRWGKHNLTKFSLAGAKAVKMVDSTHPDRFYVITKSVQPGHVGEWQASAFDANGAYSHFNSPTLTDAILSLSGLNTKGVGLPHASRMTYEVTEVRKAAPDASSIQWESGNDNSQNKVYRQFRILENRYKNGTPEEKHALDVISDNEFGTKRARPNPNLDGEAVQQAYERLMQEGGLAWSPDTKSATEEVMGMPPAPESPLQRDWTRLKAENPDALLIVRLGDFYELFNEDAKTGAAVLKLALTKRNKVDMAGFPFHAANQYITKLLEAGHKVAIADVQDPNQPRKITDVLSPNPKPPVFEVGEKVIWHAPGTGEDVEVNYRGPLGTDKAVVVGANGMQMSVQMDALRKMTVLDVPANKRNPATERRRIVGLLNKLEVEGKDGDLTPRGGKEETIRKLRLRLNEIERKLLPKQETHKTAEASKTITRFSHKDGKGMLDRSAWDLSKLSEDEELELPELLDFGLEQPRDVPGGSKFYFTEEGLKKHAKLIRLIRKASKTGLVKETTSLDTEPVWKSRDGQIAISPQSKTAEAPPVEPTPVPETTPTPNIDTPAKQAKPFNVKEAKQQKSFILSEIGKAIAEAPETHPEWMSDELKADYAASNTDIPAKTFSSATSLTGGGKVNDVKTFGYQEWEKRTAPILAPLFEKYNIPTEAKASLTYKTLDGVERQDKTGGPLDLDERWAKLRNAIKNANDALKPRVVIEVPGDGVFRILNTKKALADFKERASTFPTSAPAKKASGNMRSTPATPAKVGKLDKDNAVKAASLFVSSEATREAINNIYSDGEETIATNGRAMIIINLGIGGTKKEPLIQRPDGTISTIQFPNYKQVIPTETHIVARDIDLARLFNIIKQAQQVVDDDETSVILWRNRDGTIGVTAASKIKNQYSHNIQDGAKIIVSVNGDYVLDMINGHRLLGDEKATLRAKFEPPSEYSSKKEKDYNSYSGFGPIVMESAGAKSIVMPMRINGGPRENDVTPESLKVSDLLPARKELVPGQAPTIIDYPPRIPAKGPRFINTDDMAAVRNLDDAAKAKLAAPVIEALKSLKPMYLQGRRDAAGIASRGTSAYDEVLKGKFTVHQLEAARQVLMAKRASESVLSTIEKTKGFHVENKTTPEPEQEPAPAAPAAPAEQPPRGSVQAGGSKPGEAPKPSDSPDFKGDAPVGSVVTSGDKTFQKISRTLKSGETQDRWYMIKDGKPHFAPVNSKQHAQLEAMHKEGPPPPDSRPATLVMEQAAKVRVKAPEGATAIRATDDRGRKSVQSLAALNTGDNVFRGVTWTKLEAGTKNKAGDFVPMEGDVSVSEVKPKAKGAAVDAVQERKPEAPKVKQRQTDTPEFKRWFAGSKVVNQDGSPKLVAHGTVQPNLIESFDRTKSGRKNLDAVGTWLSDPAHASVYGGTSYPVYVNIRTPLVFEWTKQQAERFLKLREETKDGYQKFGLNDTERARLLEIGRKMNEVGRKGLTKKERQEYDDLLFWEKARLREVKVEMEQLSKAEPLRKFFDFAMEISGVNEPYKTSADVIRKYLKDRGYDGVIIKNSAGDSGSTGIPADIYLALEPEQVKSAIGNKGSFDPKDPRIDRLNGRPHPEPVDRTGVTKKQYLEGARLAQSSNSVFSLSNDKYHFTARHNYLLKAITEALRDNPELIEEHKAFLELNRLSWSRPLDAENISNEKILSKISFGPTSKSPEVNAFKAALENIDPDIASVLSHYNSRIPDVIKETAWSEMLNRHPEISSEEFQDMLDNYKSEGRQRIYQIDPEIGFALDHLGGMHSEEWEADPERVKGWTEVETSVPIDPAMSPQPPTAMHTPEDIIKELSRPDSTISEHHRKYLRSLAESELMTSAPKFRMFAVAALNANAQGMYLWNQRLILFRRFSEAATPIHEFFHHLQFFLSDADQKMIRDLRLQRIRELLNSPDSEINRINNTYNRKLREQLKDLEQNSYTSDGFNAKQFADGSQFANELYRYANEREFFAHLMSEKAIAEWDRPEARTFVEKVRKIIRQIINWWNDTTKRSSADDALFRKLLSGDYDYEAEAKMPWGGNVDDTDFLIARNRKEYETKEIYNEIGTQAATIGGYRHFFETGTRYADEWELGKNVRALVGLARAQTMTQIALDRGGRVNYYDAINNAPTFGERETVKRDAWENVLRTQFQGLKLRKMLKSIQRDMASSEFTKKVDRATVLKDKAELKEEARKTFVQQVSAAAGRILHQLTVLRHSGALQDQLKNDLDRMQRLPEFSHAVSQRVGDIVEQLAQNDAGISLLLLGGEKSGSDIADAYWNSFPPESRPQQGSDVRAYIELASAVLSANRDMRNALTSLQLIQNGLLTALEVNAAGRKVAEDVLNNPVHALKRLTNRTSILATKAARAEAAWLALNRNVQRTLRQHQDYSDAVRLHEAIWNDPEYRQYVNDVTKNVGGKLIPDNILESYIRDHEKTPDEFATAMNRALFEYSGKQRFYTPSGEPVDINMGWTPTTVQKSMEQLGRLAGDISHWLGDPANEHSTAREFWEDQHKLITNALMSSAVWNPVCTRAITGGKTGSFGMPETFYQKLSTPQSKLAFIAQKNFDRAFTRSKGWYNETYDDLESALRTARNSHEIGELYKKDYQRGILNAIAWEFRNGREVVEGSIINGHKITSQDLAYLRFQAAAFSKLYGYMTDISREAGTELVTEMPRILDEFTGGAWGYRKAQELGIMKGTTLPRAFSMHGKQLARDVHSYLEQALFEQREKMVSNDLDQASLDAELESIRERYYNNLENIWNDPDVLQNFVLGFMRQRNAQIYRDPSPFEEHYKALTDEVSGGRKIGNVDEIVDYLHQHTDEEESFHKVRRQFYDEMAGLAEKFYQHYAKHKNSDVTIVSDAKTRDTAFTKAFAADVGPAYFYDFGAIDAGELRRYATDMTLFSFRRMMHSMQALRASFDDAMAKMRQTKEVKADQIEQFNREFKSGESFMQYQELQDRTAELDRFINGIGVWADDKAIKAEGISLKTGARIMSDVVGAALSGPRTVIRVSGITAGGSAIKMGQVLYQSGFGRFRSYPAAAASAIISMLRNGTAQIAGWYIPEKKQVILGKPLRLLSNVPKAARAFRSAPEGEKAWQGLEALLSNMVDEQYSAMHYWYDQKRLGMTPDTPLSQRIANILAEPFTKGGVYRYAPAETKWGKRGQKLAEWVWYRPMSVGEAGLTFAASMFPQMGYNVNYDSVGRAAAWYVDTLAAQARRSFETHEKLGTLGQFDFQNLTNPKNQLKPWEVLPSFWKKIGIDPGKMPAWTRPTDTNLNFARELFHTSTDFDLQDLTLRYWDRLRQMDPSQRGSIEFLAPDKVDLAEAKETANARMRGIISRFVEQSHHSAPSNRPFFLQKAPLVQAYLPFVGWTSQTLSQMSVYWGKAAQSKFDSHGALMLASLASAMGWLLFSFVGGELESRALRLYDRYVNHKETTIKTIDEAQDAKEVVEIAIHDITASIPVVNSTINMLMGAGPTGQAGFQAFALDRINAVMNYARGVMRTHDITYGTARLLESFVPLTEPLIENLTQRKGFSNNRNAVRAMQNLGPQDLVERRKSSSTSLPTELTPLRMRLVEAVYSGDIELAKKRYDEFLAKATELGRPDPERLAQQTFSSINPYREAFGTLLSEEQKANMLAKAGAWQRENILNAEQNYARAADAIGRTAHMSKEETPAATAGTTARASASPVYTGGGGVAASGGVSLPRITSGGGSGVGGLRGGIPGAVSAGPLRRMSFGAGGGGMGRRIASGRRRLTLASRPKRYVSGKLRATTGRKRISTRSTRLRRIRL